jgi:dTDP-L-rhamnose 4-epimerase
MANILITGGAGFIGSHTADALIERGHRVRVLDTLDPQIHGTLVNFPSYMNPSVECIRGDVSDPNSVRAALQNIDAVYHFAAHTGVGQSMYDMRSYTHTNCVGTATLLEAIVKERYPVKRFVLASSRAVYGEGTHFCHVHGTVYPGIRKREDMEKGRFDVQCPACGGHVSAVPTKEDRPLKPTSMYGWTKKQQEDQCLYVAETFGLPITILRYFNVYGTRQSLKNPYTGVMTVFFNRIMTNQPIFIYEHGTPLRDFVHVSDVVQANLLALEKDVPPEFCINIGSGQLHTISDIASAMARACGKESAILDSGEFRVGDIHACIADLERAQKLLGYVPKISLEAGMKTFVDWAKGQEYIDLFDKSAEELRRHNLLGRSKKS